MDEEKKEQAAISLASKLTFSIDSLIIRMITEITEGKRELKNPNYVFFEAEILQWWGRMDLLARIVYISDPINLFENCCDHFLKKEKEKKTILLVDDMIEEWNRVDQRLKILIFVKKKGLQDVFDLKENIEEFN